MMAGSGRRQRVADEANGLKRSMDEVGGAWFGSATVPVVCRRCPPTRGGSPVGPGRQRSPVGPARALSLRAVPLQERRRVRQWEWAQGPVRLRPWGR